jgi:chemotaxis response regulator CheB
LQPTLVRILVVDDFGPIRRFVCEALGKRQHLQVVGEALDGLEAIQKAVELKPELAAVSQSHLKHNLARERDLVNRWRILSIWLRQIVEHVANPS